MGNWHSAVFHKDLIPVGMVAMMVCIKSKSYRLVCQGADFADDQLCPRREIRVDHQDVIFKNDPAVVADGVRSIRHLSFVKIDVGGHKIRVGSLRYSFGNWPGQKFRLRRDT